MPNQRRHWHCELDRCRCNWRNASPNMWPRRHTQAGTMRRGRIDPIQQLSQIQLILAVRCTDLHKKLRDMCAARAAAKYNTAI